MLLKEYHHPENTTVAIPCQDTNVLTTCARRAVQFVSKSSQVQFQIHIFQQAEILKLFQETFTYMLHIIQINVSKKQTPKHR